MLSERLSRKKREDLVGRMGGSSEGDLLMTRGLR